MQCSNGSTFYQLNLYNIKVCNIETKNLTSPLSSSSSSLISDFDLSDSSSPSSILLSYNFKKELKAIKWEKNDKLKMAWIQTYLIIDHLLLVVSWHLFFIFALPFCSFSFIRSFFLNKAQEATHSKNKMWYPKNLIVIFLW